MADFYITNKLVQGALKFKPTKLFRGLMTFKHDHWPFWFLSRLGYLRPGKTSPAFIMNISITPPIN